MAVRCGGWGICLFALALVASAPVHAEEIEVRARTTLSLEVRPDGHRLTVSGTLRDNIFQGLEGRTVILWLDRPGWRRTRRGPDGRRRERVAFDRATAPSRESAQFEQPLRTDRNGQFQFSDVLDPGVWIVGVDFDGGEFHAPASAMAQVELRRRPLELEIEAPVATPLWAPLDLTLTARSQGMPVQERGAFLHVGELRTDYFLVTDREGRASLSVETISRPGEVPVSARFAGDDVYEPARAEVTVLAYSDAAMTLDAEVHEGRRARVLTARGRLTSDQGPLGGAEVHIAVEGDRIATVHTDQSGAFAVAAEVERAALSREYGVRAVFDPQGEGDPELWVSAETEVVVSAGPFALLGHWARFAAAGAGALLLVGLLAFRIAEVLHARRAAARTVPRPGSGAPEGLVEFSMPHGHAPKGLNRVGGVVLDADSGEPLSQGNVEVIGAEIEQTELYPVAVDGSFSTAALPPGKTEIRVSSAGYVSHLLSVRIPHRGRYSHVEVHLCSVRSWVRYLYRKMTVELNLDEERPDMWGVLTPRGIERIISDAYRRLRVVGGHDEAARVFQERLRKVLERDAAGASERVLRALTLLVEEVYYSGRVYAEDMVELCRALVGGVWEVVQR